MDFYSTLFLKKSSGGDGGETYAAFKAYADGTLTNITEKMMDGVNAILDSAFLNCTSLTSIVISDSVARIDGNTFPGCTSLSSVTVKRTNPPTLASGVFDSVSSGLKIYVPSASVNAYKAASGWSSYKSKIYAIPS